MEKHFYEKQKKMIKSTLFTKASFVTHQSTSLIQQPKYKTGPNYDIKAMPGMLKENTIFLSLTTKVRIYNV